MYEIADAVRTWLAEGRDVEVATVVSTRGFSSRKPAAAAAWTAGSAVGDLATGVSAERLARSSRDGAGLTELEIAEADALAAGLACGGIATLLVQPATAYPSELWDRLLAREPVCLVTTVPPGGSAETKVFTATTIRDAYGYAEAVPRLFGRGSTAAALLDGDPRTVAVAYWPVPTLAVVGDGLIADALRDVAALLGWSPALLPGVGEAVAAAGQLHRSDAVVVLSHDRQVDGPALAAALAGDVGYVGALGSRRTQAARREWLTEHGVTAEVQARIHGPAGLDIDAHTPSEIAISIVAEILAHRSSATGGALRDRPGPVHVGGVHAPPPRYGARD